MLARAELLAVLSEWCSHVLYFSADRCGERWGWIEHRGLISLWSRTTGPRKRNYGRKLGRSPDWLLPWVWARSRPKLLWTPITRRKWRRRSLKSDSISTLTSEPPHAKADCSLPSVTPIIPWLLCVLKPLQCWLNATAWPFDPHHFFVTLLSVTHLPFQRAIRGETETDNKRDSRTFNIDRLFEAAASRDTRKLAGLHQYLHQNMKKLSDSLCECDTHNAISCAKLCTADLWALTVVTRADQSYGKTALMKALLHLRDGKNETVELLIDISEKMGDIKKFVDSAYTNSYYKGKPRWFEIPLQGCEETWRLLWYVLMCDPSRPDGPPHSHREEEHFLREAAGQ